MAENVYKVPGIARLGQNLAVMKPDMTSSQVFQDLVRGIQSGETEVLRTLGLNVNFDGAYRDFAREAKKGVDALTEYEPAPSFPAPCKARHSCPILVVDSYNLYEWYTTMTRLNVSKAREEFPEVVNRAAYGKERTIVSRRGKDLAAVIPIDDLRLLERLAQEELDRIDLEDARAALAEAEEKGTISLEDARKRLGL